jgi:YVTN family beta-propeller protein
VNARHDRGPYNRSALLHNRAACPLAVLLAICCCLSAASGQWFEGYIALPDSLHAGGRPLVVAYNPVNHKTYVGGDESDRLIVFDSVAAAPVGSVRVGPVVNAVCVDSVTNCLYCTNYLYDSIAVVDASSGSLIRRLWSGGDRPRSLCYSPRYRKVYCGNFDNWVQVVDAQTRQPLKRVLSPCMPGSIACDPNTGLVFMGGTYDGVIAILDGANDSIVAQIPLKNGDVTAVLFNTADGLVYASNDNRRVYVIDPAEHQVIDSVVVGGMPCGLCLNSVRGKLYVPCYTSQGGHFVAVVDCATRQVVAEAQLDERPLSICYNRVDDKAYCSTYGNGVSIIDGATDSVIVWDETGDRPINLCYSEAGDRVFSANYDGRSVTIIDGVGNGVIATTSVCGTAQPDRVCWDSFDRRMYVTSAESLGKVWVVDGVTDAVCDSIRVGLYPCDIRYNARQGKVYCANRGSGTVSVIDCRTNDVVATVPTGNEPYELNYSELHDKVYCANRSSKTVSVISGSPDSVIANIGVGTAPSALCYNPRNDRLYCANSTYSGSVSVVDCVGDTVVKTIGVRWPGRMVCDTVLNFVYGEGNFGLMFIDCALDSIVAVLDVNPSSTAFDALTIMNHPDHLLLVGSHRAPPPPQRGLIYGYTIVNTATRSVVSVKDLTQDVVDHPVRVFRSGKGNVYCSMDNSAWCITNNTQFNLGVTPNGFALNPYWNQVLLPAAQSSCIAVIGESHVPAVEEDARLLQSPARLPSTLVTGALYLPAQTGSARRASAFLLDVSGRVVLNLHPGANDVRALAPGVYFVREEPQASSPKPQAVQKVVITR